MELQQPSRTISQPQQPAKPVPIERPTYTPKPQSNVTVMNPPKQASGIVVMRNEDYYKIKQSDNSTRKTLIELTNWMSDMGMQKVKNKKRVTWESGDGNYWQWDSQHGALEKWDARKKNHLGEYNPVTGKQTKPGDKSRTFDE